ncbi:MAG: glycosyltransferase family 4 protein [Paludibacteraceae bacterium]
MKIFMIARGYPSQKDPQWGCFEKDQAEALQKAGHEVVMLSIDTRFRWYYRPLGITHRFINGIHSYDYFLIPRAISGFWGKKVNMAIKHMQLNRLFKQAVRMHGNPDLLYAHYMTLINLAIPLHLRYNIPLVGIEHWSEMGKGVVKPSVIKFAKNTYPYVNQLIAVSDSLRKNIKKWGGNDALVVHNMIGKEFTYQPNNTPHPFTMVSTGRLVYGKGFDLLIEALHRINNQLPKGWQCNIIGGGEKKAELQQQIDQAQLHNHIHFVGQKTKQEIVQLLQQSDIFVLPSRSETFGVVYIEATACGLPIIATDCGGPKEIVTPQNGVLIPMDDTDALAKAILHMVTHLSDYDRQAIAADCQANFSPEVIAKQLTDIFEKVLAEYVAQ